MARLGIRRTMADAAASAALQRAAERTQRRVELEVARELIERTQNFELSEAQAGWLTTLSMPYTWIPLVV